VRDMERRITNLERHRRHVDRYPRLIDLAKEIAVEQGVALDELLTDIEDRFLLAGPPYTIEHLVQSHCWVALGSEDAP
jgi:hypothetical protein